MTKYRCNQSPTWPLYYCLEKLSSFKALYRLHSWVSTLQRNSYYCEIAYIFFFCDCHL